MKSAEVIIIGGGLAGLSAAIYLGRALRDTLVIDVGKSMARWEPDVQNYLGFPKGISGDQLLLNAREQARRYRVHFTRDTIVSAQARNQGFRLKGKKAAYSCARLLLATGIFHIPPEIPEVRPCLGHSMFFCKDCDGYRVRAKSVGVYGWTNEAVEYALGMLSYSPCVALLTDGHPPQWDRQHAQWVQEYKLPVYNQVIVHVQRQRSSIRAMVFKDGACVAIQALFTTRGDMYFNKLARSLKAKVDKSGEIIVDADMRTTVKGVYAAGCVTPANCQMIIAAGQGATAAQAINRDLFETSLATHSLRRFRQRQLRTRKTRPSIRLSSRREPPPARRWVN